MADEPLLRAAVSLPERELAILEYWRQICAFPESMKRRAGNPRFTFYDGPPFATGLPHYGHLLAGTIKDVIPRYKTMQGFHVPRRFGWDCHGLPVENEIERHFELTGAHSVESFGIPRFNEECRKIVLKYSHEWEKTVERIGRWVDFTSPYRTMDPEFMESVWWVFQQLWEKGLVYEGLKVMPFSWKLGTPLSNFEANLNYKEVKDPAITVAFPLREDPQCALLIWTTTPWTLPSNLAVGIHPDLAYVRVATEEGRHYLLAADRVEAVLGISHYTILKQYKGADLVGLAYEPPFHDFVGCSDAAHQILSASFVSTEEGTGLVHCAPGFGEEDFLLCQAAGIPLVCPVDANGCFTAEVPFLQGRHVKEVDAEIIAALQTQGRLLRQETILHRYPFCWRSDTPLIYRAVRTWFVAVEPLKERLLQANAGIHWVPGHIRDGRFGKWLEGARDWAVSRNRYWGTPIPIWRSEDGDCLVIGSKEELARRSGHKLTDLHRHFIDEITIEHEGKTYRRIPEVFDCWFESGAMPYASQHYPFEGAEAWSEIFPADFIAEGLDQTRGWFYTLTVLAVALFDQPAFLNCIVNGIVLAEDGQKMSKRLKNYPEPSAIMEEFGADAVRLYLLSSPAVEAEDLCFQRAGVEQQLRQLLLPLWNALRFFTTYARLHDWSPPARLPEELPELDQWILASLEELTEQVTKRLDAYTLKEAVEPLFTFIDDLTNWYIRRSRRRFWSPPESAEQAAAYATLHHVLRQSALLLAPFAPFMAEGIWRELGLHLELPSVHWADWPTLQPALQNSTLLRSMAAVRTAVSLGHGLRKRYQLKVRQPLKTAWVAAANPEIQQALQQQRGLLAEELNVRDVVVIHDPATLVQTQLKPNFRVLGKRVGAKMPEFQQALAVPALTLELALSTPLVEGCSYVLQEDDLVIEYIAQPGQVAASDAGITISLDTFLDADLIQEGIARDLINKINHMRKESGLEITDRIRLLMSPCETLRAVWKEHGSTIAQDVLATHVEWGPLEGAVLFEYPGGTARLAIQKEPAA